MPRPFRRPTAAILLAASCALAVGAGEAAAAPTVATPDRCYIYWPGAGSQPIPLRLSGFAAGQQVRVELRVRGVTVSGLPSLTADPSGAVTSKLSTWTSGLRPGPTRAASSSVVVLDPLTGAELASTPVRVANAGLKIDRARSGTAERRWTVSGISRLTGGRAYHAFYFRKGRQVAHHRLGPTGECGYLRTRAPLADLPGVGTYQLRIQASSRFRMSRAWLGATVTREARRSS